MKEKLIAGFMAALMTLSMTISGVLATTLSVGNFVDSLGVPGTGFYIVVGSSAAVEDVVSAVDTGFYLASLSKETKSVAGAVSAVDGVEREGIALGRISGGDYLYTAITGGAGFPSSGLLKAAHYSALKDTTLTWYGNQYDYRDQVDVSGVTMRHDLATDKINGTETMYVESSDVKYEFVFEKALNLSSAGSTSTTAYGTIANPDYTNSLKIKLMGVDFTIVGVGATSIKALAGSAGTASSTKSVDYGDYKFYAVLGSSNSLQIDVKDKDGNAVETLTFIGIASGTAASKTTTKTSSALDVTVTSFGTLTDGTVIGADLVVGPQGTTTHEYDQTADVTSTGTASDRFPGVGYEDWGIEFVPGTGAASGYLGVNSKVRVIYKPSEPLYLKVGGKLAFPNSFAELGFEGWNVGDNFATITVKPWGSGSVYNSTPYQIATDVYGLVIESDKSGVIQSVTGNMYSKAYVVFNKSRAADTYPVAIGFPDTQGRVIVNDSWAGAPIHSVNNSGEYAYGVLNLTGTANTTTYAFKLNNGEFDYYINVTVGNLTFDIGSNNVLYFNVTAGNSTTTQDVIFTFQNKTAWTTSAAPQFQLGPTALTAEDYEVNATTEGTPRNAGKKTQEVVSDSGIILASTSSSAASDAIKVKVASKNLAVKAYFGKLSGATTGTTYDAMIPVTSPVAYLDTEVTDAMKAQNLVLVGGPCVNTLVASLATAAKFGYTCEGWPARNFGLVQVIDGAFTTGKFAVVIAGTRAQDTRLACHAVQQYVSLLKGKTATTVEVTSLQATGILEK